MKKTLLLILAVLLSVMASVQKAMAQKVTLYSAGSKAYECDIAQLDSIVFSEGQTIIPDEEIVVTVDANGNADGGHQFTRIDEATFLIDDIKYRYENGSLLVSGYDPVFFAGTAKIISKLIYNGRAMNVVGIDNKAFSKCTSLTSVTIPESVTSIGYEAFRRCSSLTSVTIPNSVTSIGYGAFSGTPWYDNQPDGLVYAGRLAYEIKGTMPEGTEIVIKEGTLGISDYAFQGCPSLTSVTIPNSVTSIGNGAFSGCSGLTSVTIGSGVTSIGLEAFSGCRSLTSIIIPESVTSIGTYAFYGCFFKTEFFVNNSSLTSDNNWWATLYDEERSDGLIIINNIVVGCRPWAVSITIPNNVTSIGNDAFYRCRSLTSVTIPKRVTSIGVSAFSGCSGLTDVYCYAVNVPTGYNAFDNSPISSATLHVPAGSVSAYKAASPWNQFGSIVAIE